MSEDMKESILGALENVIDPELGIDIVNLGLVYEVDLDEEGLATVTMTLTSMGCPLGPVIVDQVNTALGELPEVKKVDVNIVWQPAWSKDMMSRYAKMALGIR
ncbi:metal-sulfur cluster assembly factor [Lysinibacillus fusiformis]|nr:metal-sulfur cluster assembly factor [Lysinibacillus fusiformis]